MQNNNNSFCDKLMGYPYKEKLKNSSISLFNWIKLHPYWSVFIALTLIPLGLYFRQFNDSLSGDPQSWSVFGTYIGGVYGPIFTLASVFILAATLLAINNFNKKVLDETQRSNSLSQIIKLIEILDLSLNKNAILTTNREYTFQWLTKGLKDKFLTNPPENEQEIWDAGVARFKPTEIGTFHDEIAILHEILLRINNAEDEELKESAKAAFRAIIRNEERFWLECFAKRFHSNTSILLPLWRPPFSIIPNELNAMIVQPEDVAP
ncbi:hypothetical protein [Enterobacter kobei]|uniref:hypothetical protein n=1 Tax=Enterobacter kobei TaxID=208224 RepID=UPI002FD55710